MTVLVPNLSVSDLGTRIQPGFEVIEHHSHEAVSGSRDLMDQLTSHLALAGGKRLRSVLTLVCVQLEDPARALDEAVITGVTATELIHLVSLYHDDVMDSAFTRRGVSSARRLRGSNRAILTGDVLFAHASVLIATLGSEMVSHHARTLEHLYIGQSSETSGPEGGQDCVDLYIKILTDKTGSLVATVARLGAWFSGAGEEVTAIMFEFGECIGVVFQIADDVINLISNDDTFGKTPGTDLREGINTLPVLLLRRRLTQSAIGGDGRRVLEALGSDLSSNGALAELVATLRRHEVLEETHQMARDWSMRAIKTFEPSPEEEAKIALIAFAHLMVDRLT